MRRQQYILLKDMFFLRPCANDYITNTLFKDMFLLKRNPFLLANLVLMLSQDVCCGRGSSRTSMNLSYSSAPLLVTNLKVCTLWPKLTTRVFSFTPFWYLCQKSSLFLFNKLSFLSTSLRWSLLSAWLSGGIPLPTKAMGLSILSGFITLGWISIWSYSLTTVFVTISSMLHEYGAALWPVDWSSKDSFVFFL